MAPPVAGRPRSRMRNHFTFDVEADGPCPGLYSMVSFGVVAVWDETIAFKGELAPVTSAFVPEALAVSGLSRCAHEAKPDPSETMVAFDKWLLDLCGSSKPTLWSDNPAFDWQWINYYMHRYIGSNRCGYSARRISYFYAGYKRKVGCTQQWKRLRRTNHTHDPVDDARGNAEALNAIISALEGGPDV